MDWTNRINETINFTSPDGDTFSAFWIGNARSLEKKLGVFRYPKVQGAVIQDLDINAVSYPLTFFFEGIDHDLESDRFFSSCSQSGPWQVEHPTKGMLSLQLISVSEEVEPIKSGNLTQINSEWIETSDEVTQPSTAQLSAEIDEEINKLNESAGSQFSKVKTDSFSKLAAVKKSISNVVGTIKETTAGLKKLSADVNAAVDSIQRGIQDTLDAVIFEPLKLVAQVQQLIELPALAINDFTARIESYKAFAEEVFNMGPDNNSESSPGLDKSLSSDESLNVAKSQELSLTATIAAVAQTGTTSSFSTRAKTIEAIEVITELFTAITDNLDTAQTNFSENSIDHQYFSQSETFIIAARIIAKTNALLIRKAFDLQIEKRIRLDRPRTPVEIAVTEYGGFAKHLLPNQ